MATRFADLRERTLQLGLRVIKVCDALPRKRAATVIANQLVRSGTAVGAHFRESVRARSDAEIISKLESALQEIDETDYWLELIGRAKFISEDKLVSLRKEVDEVTAILVTCVKKVKERRGKK
jgi:four helix bundle protein